MTAHRLDSADDHKLKPMPRPKWNIDTVRAGVIVYNVAHMEAVYEAIGKVGSYLRVKNGFSTAESNYGYRAILVNLKLESDRTVDEIFLGPQRKKWEALAKALGEGGDGRADFETNKVLDALKAYSRRQPVNIATEVQLIYRPYLERGRNLSHLLYKIVRCESSHELSRDASGKRHTGDEAEALGPRTSHAERHRAEEVAEQACMAIEQLV